MRATMIAARLHVYATQTATDMDDTLDAAIRAMRDDPGEVAGDLDIERSTVIDWCDSHSPLDCPTCTSCPWPLGGAR